MILNWIDVLVIAVYLILLIIIGLVQKKKSAENKEAYLLGGNKLPWYMLGLSNASGMFDISGTMWMVTLAFVYGMKSIWIPWLWPCFNQIFLMVYLSAWLRRSGVTTGAEWITFRFGKDRGSVWSHAIVVVFALISCFGFLAYAFIGLGKFVEIFIPWAAVAPYIPFEIAPQYVPHFYGIVFTLFAVFYSIVGGMSSIVFADVLQYAIMTLAGIAVAVIAMIQLNNVGILNVPESWMNPFFGWNLDINWTGIIDDVNLKIQEDGYELFSIFFTLMLFKGVLASLAGPAPSYDMQKILSAKSGREASLVSGFVNVVLFPTRYLMIIGFAVLGLLFYNELNLQTLTGVIDFERILPAAILQFMPVGLTGLLLAGLLSAFIGTFAGTLNAAQAYIINDIYLKYVKPKASNRSVISMTYITGIIVVIISIILGIFAKNVNSMLQWLASGLYGSYVAANMLKWHWWRFNGSGYFWGMLCGLIPALVFPHLIGGLDLYYWPWILLISTAGCIIGTYLAPATDSERLVDFYKKVRPWGAWKPIRELAEAQDPEFKYKSTFKRDTINVVVGMVWQVSLVIVPMYLVLMEGSSFAIAIALLIATTWFLKKNWYDKLEKE